MSETTPETDDQKPTPLPDQVTPQTGMPVGPNGQESNAFDGVDLEVDESGEDTTAETDPDATTNPVHGEDEGNPDEMVGEEVDDDDLDDDDEDEA
jgi:hypothetical protein